MACGCIWVGVKRTSIVSGRGRTPSRSSLGNTLSFLDRDVCVMSYVRSATQSRSHFWESSQTTCWLVFLRNAGYITLLSCTSARMMKITLKLLLVLVQRLICAACWQLHANTKINVFDANCQPSVADVLDFRCLCVCVKTLWPSPSLSAVLLLTKTHEQTHMRAQMADRVASASHSALSSYIRLEGWVWGGGSQKNTITGPALCLPLWERMTNRVLEKKRGL